MKLHVMPGFSLVVLVIAACMSMTGVESAQRGGTSILPDMMNYGHQGTKTGAGAESIPLSPSGNCATSRRNCMNFQTSSMHAINRQINLELSAFYSYTAMGSYFASTDASMRGTAAFFRSQAQEEMAHANMFIDYILMRGGDLNLSDIRTPNATRFTNIMTAMQHALDMEITVTESLLNVYDIATENNDPSLADFLDGNFISEQVTSMDQLSHYVSVLERMDGDAVGEYIFDTNLYNSMQAAGGN